MGSVQWSVGGDQFKTKRLTTEAQRARRGRREDSRKAAEGKDEEINHRGTEGTEGGREGWKTGAAPGVPEEQRRENGRETSLKQILIKENGTVRTWRVESFDAWPEAYALRWPHFTPKEMASKCGSPGLLVDARLMDALEALRGMVNVPLRVNSGYRAPKHNAAIGGSPKSQHVHGRAADLSTHRVSVEALAALAEKVDAFSQGGIGVYPEEGFVHVDVRGERARWTGHGENRG